MRLFLLLFCGLSLFGPSLHAQEALARNHGPVLVFCSPEIQISVPSRHLEFRVRTFQSTYNAQAHTWSGRQDLMIGWVSPSNRWKVFSYTQLADQQTAWTGIRVDRSFKMSPQWSGLLQYRAFASLNRGGVPYQFSYGQLTRNWTRIQVGAFYFAKDWWDPAMTRKDYFFAGPLVKVKWHPHCYTLTGVGKDLTRHYRALIMLRLAVCI